MAAAPPPTLPPLAFVLDPTGGPAGAALAAAFTARGNQGVTRPTLALDFVPFDRLRALVILAGPGGLGDQRDAVITAIDGTTSDYDIPLLSDGDLPGLFRHIDALAEKLWARSSRADI